MRYLGFLLFILSLSVSGKDVITFEKLQEQISSRMKEHSSSIVYLEISIKRKNRRGEEETKDYAVNGIFFDKKGHISTVFFKEEEIEKITVWIGEREYEGRLVDADNRSNTSIVHVELSEESKAIPLGDTATLGTGQFIIGISASGKDLAYEKIANLGSVKAIIEGAQDLLLINGFDLRNHYMIPTVGMPIINMQGKVIGISNGRTVTLIDAPRKFLHKFIRNGAKKVSAEDKEDAWMGLSYNSISEDESEALDLPRNALVVSRVFYGSPASKAKVKVNDLILGVENKFFTHKGSRTFSQMRKWHDPEVGKKMILHLKRAGKDLDVELIFEKRPEESSMTIEEFGMTVSEINSTNYYRLGLASPQGVLIKRIENGSPASAKDHFASPILRRGDIITRLDGQTIESLNKLREVLEGIRRVKKKSLTIKVLRGKITHVEYLDLGIGQKKEESD